MVLVVSDLPAWGLCKCHVQCLAHDTRFLTFLPEQGWKRPLDRKNEPAGQPSELADAKVTMTWR